MYIIDLQYKNLRKEFETILATLRKLVEINDDLSIKNHNIKF